MKLQDQRMNNLRRKLDTDNIEYGKFDVTFEPLIRNLLTLWKGYETVAIYKHDRIKSG